MDRCHEGLQRPAGRLDLGSDGRSNAAPGRSSLEAISRGRARRSRMAATLETRRTHQTMQERGVIVRFQGYEHEGVVYSFCPACRRWDTDHHGPVEVVGPAPP